MRYEKGQKFEIHHDGGTWNEETDEIIAGFPLRSFTILVYLCTLPVAAAGGTVFPKAKV